MPDATVPIGPVAKELSIVVKMLTGMLSPPHRGVRASSDHRVTTAKPLDPCARAGRLAKRAATVNERVDAGRSYSALLSGGTDPTDGTFAILRRPDAPTSHSDQSDPGWRPSLRISRCSQSRRRDLVT